MNITIAVDTDHPSFLGIRLEWELQAVLTQARLKAVALSQVSVLMSREATLLDSNGTAVGFVTISL